MSLEEEVLAMYRDENLEEEEIAEALCQKLWIIERILDIS